MKKKVFAIIGLIALMVAMLPTSNALAYSALYRGVYVNPTHDGIRAIVSTGSSTGSPPNFSFTAFSPDSYAQQWDYYINPSYACIEAGTSFYRTAGSGSTGRYFYVRNQCTGAGVSSTSLSDSTFRSKYVRQNSWNDTGTSFTDENYDLRVIKLDSTPTWGAYLYNYNTSTYDWIANVTGSTGVDNGGFFWRDYGATQQETGKYCPTLYAWSIIQARGIQYRNSGTWTTLSSATYLNADSMYCIETTSTYKITHPNAYQWKLLPYGASY